MSTARGLSLMRLSAVARKEWIQLRRDTRSMLLAFALPLLLLLFFGYAITWDVRDLRLAVLDQDNTAASRALQQALEGSGYFRIVARVSAPADLDAAVTAGQVVGALVIPAGYAQDVPAGRATVQLILDGSDANTATIALNNASAVVERHGVVMRAAGRPLVLPVTPEARVWYNPQLKSRNMIVPGLIAVIMSIIAAMLTALTIAREWERGTMEQLVSTPVHRLEVVFGKMVPYVAIGVVDVAVATAAGMLVFGVPFNGSVTLLAAMTLLFLLGALGLGIFISAVMKSQVLATQVAMVATYLPALLLSGFLFDLRSMPVVLRAVSAIVPARYYIAVTRGVMLKGTGFEVLWVQGLSMLLFAAVGIGLASVAFNKRIAQ